MYEVESNDWFERLITFWNRSLAFCCIAILAIAVSGVGCGHKPEPQDRVGWVDPNKVQAGPMQHDSLPDALMERIKRVHATFADVEGMPLDQWVDDFKRDLDPEANVRIWEDMQVAYNAYCGDRDLPLETRKEVFKVVLFRSMASDEDVLAQIKLQALTVGDAKEIMAAYPSAPKPVEVIKTGP